jgi:transposase InsO family protein
LVGVNRQTYYRSFWRVRDRQEVARQVLDLVQQIRKDMPRIGTRKLHYMLHEPLSELGVGRDRLFAILKANHMLVEPKRSYHVTTNSYHRFHKHKNLIENMQIHRPEQVWVSDITYIGGRSKHSYLALITDAYSKKIMGYDLSDSLSADGSLRALKMAAKQREYPTAALIHHSDRGIQYCCDEYQKRLRKLNIQPSMTESYDPYANAIAERVNGILKNEFLLEEYDVDKNTLKMLVKDSISIYNNQRPHASCRMQTPDRMHKQSVIIIKTYKKSDRIKRTLDSV